MSKRIVILLAVIAVIYYVSLLLIPYSQDSVEGIVAYHQTQSYPTALADISKGSIPLYGKLFYLITQNNYLEHPVLVGRVFSFVALVAICIIIIYGKLGSGSWKIALTFLLFQAPLLRFGVVNRPDVPAIAFSFFAFVLFLNKGLRSLLIVVPLLVISFFIKQTGPVAATLSIGLILLYQGRFKVAFISLLAGSTLVAIPFFLSPVTWICMINGNQNEMGVLFGFNTIMKAIPTLFISLMLVENNSIDRRVRVYLIFSLLIAIVTSFKSGSNSNYFIEPAIIMALALRNIGKLNV
jgi:hypothetical protein